MHNVLEFTPSPREPLKRESSIKVKVFQFASTCMMFDWCTECVYQCRTERSFRDRMETHLQASLLQIPPL